ncbi:hypothetical protein [uncultured Tenacibaculum sp.]|uniref:hypothetical protein n=1 Tax=uncultured Tenacibaculum sp. TaxID=174713 RepID=UPI002637AFCB|nr:hypothetical protein [uncultured Tenacibaculum sp.]
MVFQKNYIAKRSLGGNWLFNAHVGLGFAKDFDTPKWIDSLAIYLAVGVKFCMLFFNNLKPHHSRWSFSFL